MMNSKLKPLESLLSNSSLSEIMFNSFNAVFAERDGKLIEVISPFDSDAAYVELIDYLWSASTLGDGILPDGSRYHITRPPVSPMGPTLTIRKFSSAHRNLEALVKLGAMDTKAAQFLRACVLGRMNILISGATGAGKTTLLNALASIIPESERIITVEDVAEMQLQHKNWVRLVARNENPGASVRECLVGSLRMRPDRIIVGECRSKETLEMLQIMNTGHEGGMSTLHANSTGDALTRLESLILFHAGAEIPLRALRRQIVDAIDVIVHVARLPSGERYVQDIMEISGMEGEVITRQSIFKCATETKSLKMTGQVPKFHHQLDKWISKDFFASTLRAA